jgi:SAM-dependent methyltransferase
MEKNEYRKHFELEENFWWFKGRRRILLNLLRQRMPLRAPLLWLDAGCGTGYNLTVFAAFGPVHGCDMSEDALGFCRRRGLRNLVRADVQHLPYRNGSFDAVSLLDVLYHKNIADDAAALDAVHLALKPGGLLLVTDSAFNILRGRHDLAVHARERYRKKELKRRLETAGFRVLRMSYFNFFLFPAVVLVRLSERRRRGANQPAQSDLKSASPITNAVLSAILRLEASLITRMSLPWGSSIVCLAVKM